MQQVQESHEQSDPDIEVQDTTIQDKTCAKEPPVRKSLRQNKGNPVRCLLYIGLTVPPCEPETWKQMQQLLSHEKKEESYQ